MKCYKCDDDAEEAICVTRNAKGDFVGMRFGFFCEKCKKCADNCPPRAIPYGDKTSVRGVEKWQLYIEKCFQYWRIIGTDCGLCMKVCPFSHPNTPVHNILRQSIKRSAFARSISVYGDDLFYGKGVRFHEIKDRKSI